LETKYIRTETIKAAIFPITAPVQQGMGQTCKRNTANVTLSQHLHLWLYNDCTWGKSSRVSIAKVCYMNEKLHRINQTPKQISTYLLMVDASVVKIRHLPAKVGSSQGEWRMHPTRHLTQWPQWWCKHTNLYSY